MSGFGLGPFGLSALGVDAVQPEELAPARIGGARKIDARTGRYEIADDGGFVAMDATAQRVLLTLALGVKMPPFITPQGEAQIAATVRTALEEAQLISTRDPDIELETVEVSHQGGLQFLAVRYKNLRTGTYQYFKAR